MKIGIFGGGQLGRMMALAGYPFNLRFSFYEAATRLSFCAFRPTLWR
jgi:5-(carboxyamino)imidazole ribonucleotide synthase